MPRPIRVAVLLLASTPLAAQSIAFEPKLLHTIPDGISLEGDPITDPNGDSFTPTSDVVWGPTGRRVAYIGRRGQTSFPIDSGIDTQPEGFHYLDSPVFSSDGDDVVWRAGNRIKPKKEKWWILRNGERSKKSYDWIGSVSIGPDGTIAFWEQPGAKIVADGSYNRGKQVFHVGKKKGKKWEDATALTPAAFSADGSTVATAAGKGGEWHVLITDKNGKQKPLTKKGFQMIDSIALSPNGKEAAVVVMAGMGFAPPGPGGMPMPGQKLVIQHGKNTYGKQFDSAGVPVFGPKRKQLAYKFADGKKMGIALTNDKKPRAEHGYVTNPVFSPDGSRMAYAAIEDAKVEPFYKMTTYCDFAIEGGKARLVTRKGKGKPKVDDAEYEGILHITFSPDGKRIAFVARKGKKWQIVCGDEKSDLFDEVGKPVFDESSKRIAFGARSGREIWWKVLE